MVVPQNFVQTISFSVDLCLLVFLWIVQLIIYPSFKKICSEDFPSWHKHYKSSISIIMGPIMIVQIILICSFSIIQLNKVNILRLILLAISWIWTLIISVPYHKKIEANLDRDRTIDLLINTNWVRTFTWSSIFISNFFGA